MPLVLVRPLAPVRRTDLTQAGGKGANLGELIAGGFRVPDGFLITTEAYSLAATAADVDPRDPASARERLRGVAIPSSVEAAIRDAYRELGEPAVAVRSSATAEDLAQASFAGQQDTILGVRGADAVLDAVRRCWASLWNERAVAYRATHDVAADSVRLAVVVQRMVDARTAGVLFTADPITGRRRRAAIDAVAGIGEALVSGAVDPEHFLVDTATGDALERRGTILSDAELRELSATGDRIERHFGAPQDIEWAIDKTGVLWIVQSRDITTLYPLPASASDPEGPLHVYFSANVAQGVLEPLTPMGLQTFRLIGSGGAAAIGRPVPDQSAGPPLLAESGMRVWIDFAPLLRDPVLRRLPQRALSVMEARSEVLVERLLSDPRLQVPASHRPPLGLIAVIVLSGLPWVMLRSLLRPDATRRSALAEVDRVIRALRAPDGARERLQAFEELFLRVPPRIFPKLVGLAFPGFLAYGLATRLLGSVARPDELQTVLRGLPHNPTTTMDLELWELARRARADDSSRAALATRTPQELSALYRVGELPEPLQRELADFLARYGHRAIAEVDLGRTRWSEDPAHLLGAIANYQRLEDGAVAPDAQFARGAREAEAMIGALVARVHGPKRLLVSFFLRRVRALAGLREQPKFQIMRLFAHGHWLLVPVGRELAARGVLADARDVFFLTLPEARRALGGADMRALVAERHATYTGEIARRHIPRILLSDGTDAEAAFTAPAADGAIRGTPASPGTATGIARVIRSPDGARLEPGEVLVAPSTDPGWTPLFLTASALVMEMGGMMSHGAVVAREYGIPAVVGVPAATERIATGQRVTVDGSAGTVALPLD